jgi:hypothetical protein
MTRQPPPNPPPGTSWCGVHPAGGAWLPVAEFWRSSRRPSGLDSMCRACRRERNRQRSARWYEAHKREHIAAVIARRKGRRQEA